MDARLRELRDSGATWPDIARSLETTAESARKRLQRLFASPAAVPVRAARRTHDKGWEPGVTWDGSAGTIISRPTADPVPQWLDLLRSWNMDPELVEVIEPVQFRSWDTVVDGVVTTLRYYKANLRQRRTVATVDVADLIRDIKRHKPHWQAGATETPRALVVVLSDWQLGKEGSEGAVDRILRSIDHVVRHVSEQRQIDRPFDRIYLLSLGDSIEMCDGHYPSQAFATELNLRDQTNLGRRLFTKYVTTLAPLVDRLVVAAIGGNHGENRRNGEAFTDTADNLDVAVWEQVADVIAMNPEAYGHVSFVLPRKELTMTLDVLGTIVGIAHGHKTGRGGNSQAKAADWWRNQAFGRQSVGDADMLVTGHFHHFTLTEDGGRVHIQAPTQDSGSQWWQDITGKGSHPGQLVFSIDERGWGGDAVVLR